MSRKPIEAEINANPKGFHKGIESAIKGIKGFDGTINNLKKSLKYLAGAAAIGAVVKGLFNMAKQLGQTADRLLDLEQITGASTDKLQEWEHVTRIAGVNSETYANAVIGLTQRLARGAEMSATLTQGVKALGLEMKDVSGNIRNGADITEEAITKLAAMEDQTQRNIIGAQLFSGAWKDIAPILALGADGIEAAKKEARDLGLVMGKESLEAANAFRIELETLSAQFRQVKMDVGMYVIPALTWIIDTTRNVVKGWKNMLGIMGSSTDNVLGTPQQQVDQFLKSIDSIIDKEERRAKLAEESISLQNQANQLLKSEDAINRRIGESYREQAKILRENSEKYATMKETEAAAALNAAEAQRAAEAQMEADRRNALGEIGRLKEDIQKAEAAYIASNTAAEQQRWMARKVQLQGELELLEERISKELGAAEAQRRGLGGTITPMGIRGGTPTLDDGHATYLEQQAEKVIALKQVSDQATETGQSLLNMEGFAMDAAFNVGKAMGDMAASGGKSTGEIIKQMMAQTVAALIRHIMVQVPFPANLALAAGAGALSSGLFSQIPAYKDGTSNHPGGMAWVGEEGPELVNLPRGASVTPHAESMAAMGGTVRFEIQGDKLYGVLQRHINRISKNT